MKSRRFEVISSLLEYFFNALPPEFFEILGGQVRREASFRFRGKCCFRYGAMTDRGCCLRFPKYFPPRGERSDPRYPRQGRFWIESRVFEEGALSSFERGGPVFINFGKRMTDGKEGSKPFSRGAENKPRRKFFRFAGKRPARPTKINL